MDKNMQFLKYKLKNSEWQVGNLKERKKHPNTVFLITSFDTFCDAVHYFQPFLVLADFIQVSLFAQINIQDHKTENNAALHRRMKKPSH